MTLYNLLLIQAEEHNRFLDARKDSLDRLQQRQTEKFFRWLEEDDITRAHLREIIEERWSWAAEFDNNGRRLSNLKARHQAERKIPELELDRRQYIRHLLSKIPLARFRQLREYGIDQISYNPDSNIIVRNR